MQLPRHSVVRRYRVNRSDLAFLKYIFESYEGLALVTVLDGGCGEVDLRIAPGSEAVVAALVDHLKESMLIEPLASPNLDKAGFPTGRSVTLMA